MFYAFSFTLPSLYTYMELPLQIFLIDLHFESMHLSQERNLYLVLLFFFKNEDFCTFNSAISSPLFQKDTTFYLYYIANADSLYMYHFLFNSSSNSSTCCIVSPLINEKSVVSSLSSLKNHCHYFYHYNHLYVLV